MASRKKSTDTEQAPEAEENTVTDTLTTEAEASPTAEATEATAPAVSDEEAAAAKAAKAAAKAERDAIDHEGNLYAAIVAFRDDSNVEALQAAYREVPAAARGKVQGVAMKRAMVEAGVDMEVLAGVLDAFSNLPAATKTTRTRPVVDEAKLAAIRLSGVMVAFEELRTNLGEDAFAQASAWYAEGAPEELGQDILKVATNIIAATTKGARSGGGGGQRNSFKETLDDLVTRGDLAVGDVLKGANGAEATVVEGGKLETLGKVYDNPSAAATAHRTKENGEKTSTNGWDFWNTASGATVGSLRKG